jgi:regulator of protease activity HflC (stomatin/prohibitin superfamily)
MKGKTIIDAGIATSKKILTSMTVLIIGLIIALNTIVVIDAGEVGVTSLFGKVDQEKLQSGIHLVNPFKKVIRMNTRTQEYTMSIAQGEGRLYGDDSIDALTKEGLSVALDITVLYRLNTDKADEVYKNIGVQYEEKIIRPQIRTSIREVVSQYLAREIYAEKRSEAQQAIMDNLQANIDARGITIENVLVRNIDLPEKLENSIEEKLTAEQESQKYEFLLDKEAKEAERKRVEAEGQRDAQAIINESLTDRYLYYQYVINLKDRPGTIYVPVSPTSGLPVFKGIQ